MLVKKVIKKERGKESRYRNTFLELINEGTKNGLEFVVPELVMIETTGNDRKGRKILPDFYNSSILRSYLFKAAHKQINGIRIVKASNDDTELYQYVKDLKKAYAMTSSENYKELVKAMWKKDMGERAVFDVLASIPKEYKGEVFVVTDDYKAKEIADEQKKNGKSFHIIGTLDFLKAFEKAGFFEEFLQKILNSLWQQKLSIYMIRWIMMDTVGRK